VVLARVDVSENGIQAINNYSCRRMVISYATMWCRPGEPDAGGTGNQEEEKRREREKAADQERMEQAIRSLRPHLTVREEELRESPRGIAEVAERRAVELRGVKSSSPLGNRLEAESVTIGRAAAMQRDEFIRFATQGMDPRIEARTKNQATEVWERARAVMETIKALEPA
jgi:hypothetical protein